MIKHVIESNKNIIEIECKVPEFIHSTDSFDKNLEIIRDLIKDRISLLENKEMLCYEGVQSDIINKYIYLYKSDMLEFIRKFTDIKVFNIERNIVQIIKEMADSYMNDNKITEINDNDVKIFDNFLINKNTENGGVIEK